MRTFWRSNYGTVENDLNTSFGKGVKLGFQDVYKTGIENFENTSFERRVD